MKKLARPKASKLSSAAETIRVLNSDTLADVRGGGGAAGAAQISNTGCGYTVNCAE